MGRLEPGNAGEVSDFVAKVEANMPLDFHCRFGWEAVDQERGNFELKIMVSLCSQTDVNAEDPKRAHMPFAIRGFAVRAVLEDSADKRPFSKAHAIFLGAMFMGAGLGRDTFNRRWLTNGIRVSGVEMGGE